jgi:predicted N-formylglutamate amidohydrolase
MDSHIAWDIGVRGLGRRLGRALDAPFVHQRYSRLVIDCNRAPGRNDSIPETSAGVPVPGNAGIAPSGRAARITEIYEPYQARIAALLDRRRSLGRTTVLVSLHSFTPSLGGQDRPWKVGVLHRGDSGLSRRMLALLRDQLGDEAGDNQPYAMDEADNTVPLHAFPRGLDYLELEVRQDLIAAPAGQAAISAFVADLLRRAGAN